MNIRFRNFSSVTGLQFAVGAYEATDDLAMFTAYAKLPMLGMYAVTAEDCPLPAWLRDRVAWGVSLAFLMPPPRSMRGPAIVLRAGYYDKAERDVPIAWAVER